MAKYIFENKQIIKLIMKTTFLFLTQLFILFQVNAQSVGINTNNPDPSAAMDINSNDHGLLIPRINLQSLNDVATVVSPATGLLLYNMNAAIPGGKGFYFNNGTAAAASWKKMISCVETAVTFASRGSATVVQPNTNYVPSQTEDFDISNNFIPVGSILFPNTFIAPVDGVYHFDGSITWTISGAVPLYVYTKIRVNAVNNISVYNYISEDITSHVSHNIKLNAGDKVTLGCKHSGNGPISVFSSYFSGNLITRL